MRNDVSPQPDPDSPGPTPIDDPRPATPPGRGSPAGLRLAKVPALLALVAATSWVVGHWVSGWLVPLYLGAMALILCPSAGATRRRGATTAEVGAPESDAGAGRTEAAADGGDSSPAPAEPAASAGAGGAALPPGEDGGPGPAAATATKPKRPRTRARKASKPPAEPIEVVEATWIEVGPGKFVRAENPAPSAPVAGPHLAVDPTPAVEVEADRVPPAVPDPSVLPSGPTGRDEGAATEPATPGLAAAGRPAAAPTPPASGPPADPLARADDAVGAAAIANDVPAIAAGRALGPPVADVAEGMFAPGLDFRAPTVDGTALQVDGPEGPVFEEEPPFDDLATGDDHAPPDDADWPPPEPAESPDFAALDAGDDHAATAAAPIEPTWPDDAGSAEPDPWDDHDRAVMDADRDEAGYPGPGTTSRDVPDAEPAVLDVPAADDRAGRPSPPRIIRLARAAARRVASRGARGGRPGRPPRSARRPAGPRRLDRRRAGRAGTIVRSARPRSPPPGGRRPG